MFENHRDGGGGRQWGSGVENSGSEGCWKTTRMEGLDNGGGDVCWKNDRDEGVGNGGVK